MDEAQDLSTRLQMNNLYGSFLKAFYTIFEIPGWILGTFFIFSSFWGFEATLNIELFFSECFNGQPRITHSGSWPSKVRPVIEKVSPWYAVLFLTYIALVVFAVIRIVTALFLQETLSNAANDADMLLENSRRLAKDYQDKLLYWFWPSLPISLSPSLSFSRSLSLSSLSLPSLSLPHCPYSPSLPSHETMCQLFDRARRGFPKLGVPYWGPNSMEILLFGGMF